MTQQIQASKTTSEVRIVDADFTSQLDVGVTISASSVTASVYSGVDATPSNLLSGASTFSGAIISQKLTGGVLGVIYELLFSATTSNAQTLVTTSYLAVVPDMV